MSFRNKYLKYKEKYINLKKLIGGSLTIDANETPEEKAKIEAERRAMIEAERQAMINTSIQNADRFKKFRISNINIQDLKKSETRT